MNGLLNRNIKNFRNFKGITQEDLARAVGKTKNVISNWEREENSPDLDSVEIICRVLGVTPNQLFGWEPYRAYEEYNEMVKQKIEKVSILEREKEKLQYEIDYLMNEIKAEELKWKETD